VVGGSLAGLRAAEALRHVGHEGPLTIVGAERHLPYDRPPLSKQILTRKFGPDDIPLHVEEGFEAEWLLGVAATGLDLERRRVLLYGGEDLAFDWLVIATGAHPRPLSAAPAGPGVHYLRTVDEAVALRDDLSRARQVVVIGAGFIGLEVASSAKGLGLSVSVVEVLPVPLERAIGAEMGAAVAAWHRRRGVEIHTAVGLDRIVGPNGPEGVRLTDGRLLPADVVVVGVGVAPTTAWLEGSGVDLENGVLCDERLRVLSGGRPVPGVVAAGDVARWAHPGHREPLRIEHWTNAAEQGESAAHTLAHGDEAPPYRPTPYFWSDQYGLKLQFVGHAEPGDQVKMIEGSLDEERFLAGYDRDGRLVAALGMRRPARVMALQKLIGEGAPFPRDEDPTT
jgi:3-phenylpropionate/trans-cinnamate dioxygenase ferredoxin reductase component